MKNVHRIAVASHAAQHPDPGDAAQWMITPLVHDANQHGAAKTDGESGQPQRTSDSHGVAPNDKCKESKTRRSSHLYPKSSALRPLGASDDNSHQCPNSQVSNRAGVER